MAMVKATKDQNPTTDTWPRSHKRLERQIRSIGERAAIMAEAISPGGARCGNCGWTCECFRLIDDEKYRYCCHRKQMKRADNFCKVYSYVDNTGNSVFPWWIDPETGERYERSEMREIIRERMKNETG